jgi:hypothetical protein
MSCDWSIFLLKRDRGSGRGRTAGERGQRERERKRERGIVQTVHSIIYFFCFCVSKKELKYADMCVTSFPSASAYPSFTTLRFSSI